MGAELTEDGWIVDPITNDGWRDLRIEVDTDDCDSIHAKAMMQEVIDRCNAAKLERELADVTAERDAQKGEAEKWWAAYIGLKASAKKTQDAETAMLARQCDLAREAETRAATAEREQREWAHLCGVHHKEATDARFALATAERERDAQADEARRQHKARNVALEERDAARQALRMIEFNADGCAVAWPSPETIKAALGERKEGP
jgi:hypothetical protein